MVSLKIENEIIQFIGLTFEHREMWKYGVTADRFHGQMHSINDWI
jgi:hypothetical protein